VAKQERAAARRRQMREVGLPDTAKGLRSRFSRTPEYRRVEKRRERARRQGIDPDALGPSYWLPRRNKSTVGF
jgi:hypothetical protein